VGGNRPGLGDYQPGVGGNRPGLGDYRPGAGSNRPGRPDYGDNLGIVNRPNPGNFRPGLAWGGGWFGNNNVWGGGMWPGFGWGGPRSRFFGNWYRGNWWGSRWAGGFGPGGMGFGRWGWRMGLFPTWRHVGLSAWGLGGWANGWLYGGFFNPYFVAPVINTTVVANAPLGFVPDYSRPLDLTSIPPEPETAEQDDLTFLAALDAFKAGDFARALSLDDLALKAHPNDPVLHEFRALCLFALGRYDEAAGVLYVVLTAGPGWDWATMIGLYSDADTYTRQLRALEAAAKRNPAAASTRFVLAYHYLVQEHVEQARQQFEQVVKLQPKDQLAAQFVKLLTAPAEAPAAAEAGSARAAATDQVRQPSPPPAALVGTWKAKPAPDLSIELTVREDGQFTWDVSTNGQANSIAGAADYADGVLTLTQDDAPALVGTIVNLGEKQFGFEFASGPQTATIQFSR
jgi:tetratricopeptide (TPR) repeat protein